MIDYRNKLKSTFILSGKYGRTLWKYLSFSLADNLFSIARIVCISIEADGISFLFGTKTFWKKSIKYLKKFPLEENKEVTPEYFAAVLSKALDEIGVPKAFFVLVVPRTWTIVQIVEFPATVKGNLANVICYELDRLTPLTPDNAYYDYKIVRETEDKIEVLLAVAKANLINSFFEALRLRNIKFEKLGIGTFVIKNLIKQTYKIENSVFIVINDGAYECGAIINNLTVRSVTESFKALNDLHIDQIVKEIFQNIELLTRKKKQAKIAIIAADQYYRSLIPKLNKIPVLNMMRDNSVRLPDGSKEISPFAIGCFLETADADQNEFNLLNGKNGKQKKTPFLATAILLSIIFLIGVFYFVSPIIYGERSIEKIDEKINSLKPEIKKIEALKEEAGKISSEIKTIDDFKKNNVPTIDILREITKILPDKSWLTRVHITEKSVEIEGYAVSATQIISRLENSRYFQKAEFASPTFRDPRQNNERFVIKTEMKSDKNPAEKKEEAIKNEKAK